jgi:hypothetical protein
VREAVPQNFEGRDLADEFGPVVSSAFIIFLHNNRAGNFHSDKLHVVERYTRTSPDVISYEATIEDPNVFTRPWKMSMPLYRRQERTRSFWVLSAWSLSKNCSIASTESTRLVNNGEVLICGNDSSQGRAKSKW